MKNTRSQYIFLIVFLIFGIVIAVQLKSTLYTKRLTISNTLSAEMLKDQLSIAQKETDKLKTAIDENLVLKNNIIKDYLEQQDDFQLADDWKTINMGTGLVDVKGPGISIKLDDAPARQPDTPDSLLIIHDQDMEIILNELKKAGAQAIAINGERIVPMSEQLCAGPTILINDNRYSVPYLVEAIGDPDKLYESIIASSIIIEMTICDIRIEINKSKELILPKFSGADNLDRYITGLEVVNNEGT